MGQATWISQKALQHPSLQDFEETKVPPHKRRSLLEKVSGQKNKQSFDRARSPGSSAGI